MNREDITEPMIAAAMRLMYHCGGLKNSQFVLKIVRGALDELGIVGKQAPVDTKNNILTFPPKSA